MNYTNSTNEMLEDGGRWQYGMLASYEQYRKKE